MAQPRLAYAGVVELPREVCHLPWSAGLDEQTLEQEKITCDPPEREEEAPSVSDSIPSFVGEDDYANALLINDMDRSNDGNLRVETPSRFNTGSDFEICFFHEKYPEDTDTEDDDEHQENRSQEQRTELEEQAVGVEANVISMKALSTLAEQHKDALAGKTFESTSIFCPQRQLCKKSISASSASGTHPSNIYQVFIRSKIRNMP